MPIFFVIGDFLRLMNLRVSLPNMATGVSSMAEPCDLWWSALPWSAGNACPFVAAARKLMTNIVLRQYRFLGDGTCWPGLDRVKLSNLFNILALTLDELGFSTLLKFNFQERAM